MTKTATVKTMSDLLSEIDGLTKKADEAPSSAINGEDPNKRTPQAVSSEKKTDLKENAGGALPVNPAGATNNATQPAALTAMGTTAGDPHTISPPDEVKDKKDDPGTESGLKAAADYSSLSVDDLLKKFKSVGDPTLAAVQVKMAEMNKSAGVTPAQPAAGVAAGYAAAQAAGELDKKAQVRDSLKKVAADMIYAAKAVAVRIKQAEEESGDEGGEKKPKPKPEGGDSGGGGGPPPAGPAGGPPPMPAGPPAGAMPPPPGDPSGGMGGPPPGMDPAAAAGGPPPGDPSGGMGGGAPDKQQAIDLILQVMQEANITPDELMAGMQQGMAPPPQGAPPADVAGATKMAKAIEQLAPLFKAAAQQYHAKRTKLADQANTRELMTRTIKEIVAQGKSRS